MAWGAGRGTRDGLGAASLIQFSVSTRNKLEGGVEGGGGKCCQEKKKEKFHCDKVKDCMTCMCHIGCHINWWQHIAVLK